MKRSGCLFLTVTATHNVLESSEIHDPAVHQPVQLWGMEATSSGDCKSVEFLPTVEALHAEHLSHARRSRQASDMTVV